MANFPTNDTWLRYELDMNTSMCFKGICCRRQWGAVRAKVALLDVFTPIPLPYTSLLLDGVFSNYYFSYFIYLEMQESSNLSRLDPFIPTYYA